MGPATIVGLATAAALAVKADAGAAADLAAVPAAAAAAAADLVAIPLGSSVLIAAADLAAGLAEVLAGTTAAHGGVADTHLSDSYKRPAGKNRRGAISLFQCIYVIRSFLCFLDAHIFVYIVGAARFARLYFKLLER